jgi:hypothetical protein
VFVRYLQQGIEERNARQRAFSEVRGYLGKGSGQASGVRLLSAPNRQNGQPADGQSGRVKAGVHAYLDANPGLDQLSVNQVLVRLKTVGVKAGRTTVAEVLQDRKQPNPPNNG